VEKTKADRINAFLQDMLGFSDNRSGSANLRKGHDATVADTLDEAAHRVETELNDQPEVKAAMLRTIGTTYVIHRASTWPNITCVRHWIWT
jgi:hypothetical protein